MAMRRIRLQPGLPEAGIGPVAGSLFQASPAWPGQRGPSVFKATQSMAGRDARYKPIRPCGSIRARAA